MRVLVVLGGESAEWQVSVASGRSVLDAAQAAGHDACAVVACVGGSWRELRGSTSSVDPHDTSGSEDPFALLDRLRPDVVFPALHGPRGEDGTIQGLLELSGIPYVGAGVLSSALAMDKAMAKELLASRGLPQVRHVVVPASASVDDALVAAQTLALPVFVKPANMGSSVGVTRVDDRMTLAAAIDTARRHDETVLVEEASTGREISCGVVVTEGAELHVSSLAETRGDTHFLDYDGKYGPDGADVIVPADLDDATAERVRRLAARVAEVFRVSGPARIDLFVTADHIDVNELNTMPGFTKRSSFPLMWAHAGLALPELVDTLLESAVGRAGQRRRRTDH